MTTIKDIAQHVGVSSATVSRVLRQDETLHVPQETREKVIAAAKALDYQRKNRSTGKATFTMGIVQWFSPQQELSDSYYLLIRQGIEDYCTKHNINVIRTYKGDVNYMTTIQDVDGLICIGKFSETEIEYFKKITKAIIFLDMPVPDPEISTITLDFKQAITTALSYLRELGHKKIGFLGGKEYLEEDVIFPDMRKKIFIDFCEEYRIEYAPFVAEGEFSSQSGYEMMNDLIEKGNVPTALLSASDSIAIGAIKALTDHQISVPDQVSVIGFDDISTAAYTTPSLTTMHAPAYDMGSYGAGIVHHMLNTLLPTAMRIQLPSTLIIRDSCN